MRKYLHIDLGKRSVRAEEQDGEAVVKVGRYLIAKTLVESGAAKVDPLSPDNPLIFSAGPMSGSNFSNANRISVGCKSPLTGGVKEANSGGTFAYALGQLEISGFNLYGASKDWVVIRITKDGVSYDSAEPYLGKSNFEVAKLLFDKYGSKVSIGLCGPVGEYLGLMAGIAFTDVEGRPSRISARGGVGAVLGAKKVKAIVVDMLKMPTYHDRKKLMGTVREYGKMLDAEPAIETFRTTGTAMMGDFTNKIGGLPVRNFSAGQLVDSSKETFRLGGDYIRETNAGRGGETTHACMPGCQIQCSNVYVDANGKELVSPMEYETLGLMGSNCGIEDPDQVAILNEVANDLGVDTIEAGATLAVLMDAGQAKFGDFKFMMDALEDIRRGTERGKLLAQGTARVGKHFKVARVPAIKGQGISAYDPRVIEVTGISMMVSAQGADHTTGNVPAFDCKDKSTEELAQVSLQAQAICAATDSLGLCIFGRSVTNVNFQLIADAVNAAAGTSLDASFFEKLGYETLKLEWEFNRQAGFTIADDELPAFFYNEPLAPTGKTARHHGPAVKKRLGELLNSTAG